MSTKSFTFEQVQEHKSRDDIWIIYSGKVYDVTAYLDEHPGGEEVILDCAGDDATEAFDDIGHSEDAHELLKGLYIGELIGGVKTKSGETKTKSSSDSNVVLFGAAAVAIAIIAYFVLNQ